MRQSWVHVSSQFETQPKNMEKSFNKSSEIFCQVEFSSEFFPHEIDPRIASVPLAHAFNNVRD